MSVRVLTRRMLLKLGAAFGLTSAACVFPPMPGGGAGVVVFRRSGRGLRISNAAKSHNANRLYWTSLAARLDVPHPGDPSYVVQVVISAALAAQLFPRGKVIADLRRDL